MAVISMKPSAFYFSLIAPAQVTIYSRMTDPYQRIEKDFVDHFQLVTLGANFLEYNFVLAVAHLLALSFRGRVRRVRVRN